MRRVRSDRGQAMLVVVVGLVFAGLLGVVVVAVGQLLSERARAQTAADAAALAGAAAGESAARELAERNGGRLQSFVTDGDEVQVSVRIGRALAVARARRGGRAARPPRGIP